MDPTATKRLLDAKLAEHGLRALGWTGRIDSAVRRFGVCNYRERTISLSRHLAAINSDEETLDTILHEIAHALAGPDCGHDERWRSVASRIGANPDGIHDAEEASSISGAYVLIHKDTGEVFRNYHRQPAERNLATSWIRGRREETLGKLEIVSARELARRQGGGGDGAEIRSFDREAVAELRSEVAEAVTSICERHGLVLQVGGDSFNPETWLCSFALHVPRERAAEGDQAEFALHARLFGLTAEDFGRTFTNSRGESFALVGIMPRNRKYPIIGRDAAGRRFKFSAEILRRLR